LTLPEALMGGILGSTSPPYQVPKYRTKNIRTAKS